MGRCLSCHKPIPELEEGYHIRCARRLFDAKWVPVIPFSSTDIVTQAAKMIGKISISGVQPKLSVHLDKKEKVLAVVETGGHFILKPQVEQFRNLPENENLCMNIAEDLGIETPPHGLLRFQDGRFCYVIRRFDRLKDGSKLHQEDFQQLTGADLNRRSFLAAVQQGHFTVPVRPCLILGKISPRLYLSGIQLPVSSR